MGTTVSVPVGESQVSAPTSWHYPISGTSTTLAGLAQYCLDQATDGSGNYAKADTATDRLVNIARGHADEVYEAEGVTYRVALSDKASDLQTCDADLTAKLDRALATLD